jgi:UDP-GlcNAc:undecaprenyl-phosphate GlcNAc-1-phosphate transferase
MQVGDRANWRRMLVCPLVAATAGFLVWNYPRGLLFAGDGGAYVWGVVIAFASLSLVQRQQKTSRPGSPCCCSSTPCGKPCFPSTANWPARVSLRRVWPMRCISTSSFTGASCASVFHDDEARRLLMRNNRTSPWLVGLHHAHSGIPAVLFWRNTPVLMGFCLLFVCTYVPAYLMIVRFKVPRWIRRGRGH